MLIIEDEAVLQDVYKFILSSHGYQVYTADNGLIGMRMLKKYKPDLILLDIFMPVMNGKQFLSAIDLRQYPKLKIVVYSNMSDSATEAEVLKLGASKMVLKSSLAPKDLTELVAGYFNEDKN